MIAKPIRQSIARTGACDPFIDRRAKAHLRARSGELEDEDYGADDEHDRGDEFSDECDNSTDVEQFRSLKTLFPSLCYEAKLTSTPPKLFNSRFDRHPSIAQSPFRQVTVQELSHVGNDDSDEEFLEEYECPPDCYLCRLSVALFTIKHPEIFSYGSDTNDEDDFDNIESSAPPTHCSTNCISCARRRLEAEGWKPVYKYDEQKQECSREEQAQLPEPKQTPDASKVLSPPPPGLQTKINVPQPTIVQYPRVFFPPPK
ncbi:hypothetical protein GYMLUDRAFT_97103 [Collybiopsis luxurians FD-317 M1]|uniref:Uncharacterized protein n=1 Tax=Collybiopsis luxurians FD-317 M1 TaxID=944289 RepID=A0A0D0B9K8_9AGAR|nr:hypothetical protein GYMLUDRAFT_97103 [Collybiopsis luxurians FD-317 M1]